MITPHLPACHPPADGSLHDACLLALLAALSTLRLHNVVVDDAGRIQMADGGEAAAAAERQQQQGVVPAHQQQQRQQQSQQGDEAAVPGQRQRHLRLGCVPVSVTCGVFRGTLLVDPTAEEEPLLETLMTCTVDESGNVLGELWLLRAEHRLLSTQVYLLALLLRV